MKYIKHKQSDGDKGSNIEYKDLDLHDYLSPSANLNIKDQHVIFSLRSKMYPLKENLNPRTNNV